MYVEVMSNLPNNGFVLINTSKRRESLVLSKLFYCSTLWANTSDSIIKKLLLVQNFAVRMITSARKYDHITLHLQEQGWLPVKDILSYRDLLIMFKCLNDMAPGYLSTKFPTRSSIHDRETRNMNDLDVPIFKTNLGRGLSNSVQPSYGTT